MNSPSAKRRFHPLDQVIAVRAIDITRQALHNARSRWKKACKLAEQAGREAPPNPWPIICEVDSKGRGHHLVVDVIRGEEFMRLQRGRPHCAAAMAALQNAHDVNWGSP